MSGDVPARIGPGVAAATVAPAQRAEIDELLGSWLETLTQQSKDSYQSDLEYFTGWIGADDVASAMQTLFSRSTTGANALVLRYRRHLLTAPVYSTATRLAGGKPDRLGFASSTVNRRLSALRSVARIARITGMFEGQLEIRGVAAAPVLDTRGIGSDAYHRMLRKIDQRIARKTVGARRKWELVRDRAILRLLHDLALRRVEVVRLDMGDVDFDELVLDVTPKGPRGVRVKVPMTKRVAEALASWVEARGDHPGPVFHGFGPHLRGKRFGLSTINRICGRRGRLAGVHCRPHGLRHTAITTGLRRTNGNVHAVASMARHKNPSTTMKYDDRSQQAARDLSDIIGEDE